MNAHSIRHAWFPPAVPKRKHDREFEAESEWPGAPRPRSEPVVEPRPAKRLRRLEGGLAKLTLRTKNLDEPTVIGTDPAFSAPSALSPTISIHDSALDRGAEPSIYEYAPPLTGLGSSAASLPLQGEVSEVNTSDEEYGMQDDMERRMNGTRMGNGVFVQGEVGVPGYTVYEPESGPEKRKRKTEDDEHGSEKKGKMSWYEPEKDRIVILDLDSSEDESVTHSPRRSASSKSRGSPALTHSQAEARKDSPELIINSTFLSHISSPSAGAPSIPREDNPGMAVVLYKPAPWATGAPEPEVADIEDVSPGSEPASMEASPPIQDDDAMDIDP